MIFNDQRKILDPLNIFGGPGLVAGRVLRVRVAHNSGTRTGDKF